MPKKKGKCVFLNEIMIKLQSSTNEGFFRLILIFGDLKIRYLESAGCRVCGLTEKSSSDRQTMQHQHSERC